MAKNPPKPDHNHRQANPHRATLSLLAAIALWGCDPSGDLEPLGCMKASPGALQLDLSTTEGGRIPFEDGAVLDTVLGPQGLHMVWFTLSVNDYERPRVPAVRQEFDLSLRTGDVLVGWLRLFKQPTARHGDDDTYEGVRVDVSKDDDAVCLNGRRVRVAVALRDGCGRPIHTERELIMRFPMLNTDPSKCRAHLRRLDGSDRP